MIQKEDEHMDKDLNKFMEYEWLMTLWLVNEYLARIKRVDSLLGGKGTIEF